MTAAAESAFGEHFALNLVTLLGEDLHLNRAIVEQHHVVNVDILDEILVVHIHRMQFLAPFAADSEGELLPGLRSSDAGRSPVRMAGPCVSIMMPAERLRFRVAARISPTTRSTQSCGACDMLRRKTFTPALR